MKVAKTEEVIKLVDYFPKELFEETYNITEVSDGKFVPMFLGDFIYKRVIDDTDRHFGMTQKYGLSDLLSGTFSKEEALEIVLDNYNESCIENKYLYEGLGLPVTILNKEDIKINYLTH